MDHPLAERRNAANPPTETRAARGGDRSSHLSSIPGFAQFLDIVREDHDYLREELTYRSPLDSKEPWRRDHDYPFAWVSPDKGGDKGEHFIFENDQAALVHMGISVQTLATLVESVQCHANKDFQLPVRSQVIMTLMKLKTNLPLADLSVYFHTSECTALETVLYWIDVLAEVLRLAIPWLSKQIIQASMPAEFRERFPNTTCFVGCGESVLRKPQGRCSPSMVKYLLAVAPCGLIMFMSPAYSGRCRHDDMALESGLLDLLVPGDEVMTPGGFAIKGLLFKRQVKLVVSSLSKDGGQAAASSSSSAGHIAHVGDHVEGAIRHLMTFNILSQGVPTTLAPQIDKILRICAALTNLRIQVLN
ncbi:uncharacterized protein si:dkey-56d12.4 isoform X1 [Phyllopteryx taeniolatus]|uniref:uncharacterized protein si:dkey-56d12.4 isoform X1 n=1 Tax=Phyllopteryx taeniolatus TaxID=161469 RepID=UPI002AD30A3D|nr:uncharacterized protein si:dkey-56d12.4 isoform X1 [Phyllopteryx taeniolatus]XP_061634440.1 uncharacterized protein si:dkey-56d12.4 isoform X1 [Phyllopteryx taeniolatus]